jgi:hypothetical protein
MPKNKTWLKKWMTKSKEAVPKAEVLEQPLITKNLAQTRPPGRRGRFAKTVGPAVHTAGAGIEVKYSVPIIIRRWADGEDRMDEPPSVVISEIPGRWKYNGFSCHVKIGAEDSAVRASDTMFME